MRIAVWSGPRNLSTALMYSFGNRADMTAVDEPFYGAFLRTSGIDHPMAVQVMAEMACDPAAVSAGLQSHDTPHQYEKHMVHHMLPGFPLDWMDDVVNVFLIRHPARVLASYLQKREEPTADDLGFTQMDNLMARVSDPIVVDSADVRADPAGILEALCGAIGIDFDPAMLAWPAGEKPFDGPWASHWYDAVHRSSGFAGEEGPLPKVPSKYADILGEAEAVHRRFAVRKLTKP
ncbi:MAG: HAD family hydrolase [Pseudomonadota bacterium]